MNLHDVRYHFLPYCIQRLDDGRYILLNRNYKPLGTLSAEWVEYEQHPSAVLLKITPAIAKKLSWKGSDDLQTIYLYNDGTNPLLNAENMNAYYQRLGALMKLPVSTD